MNKSMMKKNVGAHVRLVPPACRLDHDGFELAPIDDDWWLIQDVTDDGVTISDNLGYRKTLAYDHLYKFTSDEPRNGARRGFLTLLVQLFVQGVNIRVQPTVRPGERVPPPEIAETLVEITYAATMGFSKTLRRGDTTFLGKGPIRFLAWVVDLWSRRTLEVSRRYFARATDWCWLSDRLIGPTVSRHRPLDAHGHMASYHGNRPERARRHHPCHPR